MTNMAKAPLAGIRMLDLGRFQAGPRCGLMFARMGAEVIKIEALDGEDGRKNGPKVRGQSEYWVQYNSGKKSLAINLRTDKGKEILRELVKVSDILLQNFRPGTIETMGFGYDVLKQLNPRIIMINVSAYGQYGPYRERVGFDLIGQAIGGMMSQNGYEDGPPMRTSFPLIDRMTALHATIGALAALVEREVSGEGQAIDVCLADTGFTANEIPIAAYLDGGIESKRSGNGSGLWNMYQTTDGWAMLAAPTENMWPRVCEAFGKFEWLDDPRFAMREDRHENVKELEQGLAEWFSTRTMKDAEDYLCARSIPCAAVNGVEQAANEPHLHERELLVEVPDPIAGKVHVAGKMIKFSRTPMVVGSAPLVGQHTDDVLCGILGYSRESLNELVNDKVVRVAE